MQAARRHAKFCAAAEDEERLCKQLIVGGQRSVARARAEHAADAVTQLMDDARGPELRQKYLLTPYVCAVSALAPK